MSQLDQRAHQRAVYAFGAAVAFLGCLGLLGWLTGAVVLRRINPEYPAMHPLTAVMLIVSGLNLLLALRFRTKALILAAAVALVTLLRLVFGAELQGLANLNASSIVQAGALDRMAATTAASLLVLMSAQVLSMLGPRRFRRYVVLLALVGAAPPFLALVGYFLEHGPLYRVEKRSSMALHTAAALLLLAVGVLLLARDGLLARLFKSDSHLARISRRLLLLGFTGELILAVIRLGGQAAGFYGRETAIALHVAGSIVITVGVLAFALIQLAKTEDERRQKASELARAQLSLLHLSRQTAMATMASTLAHELNQPLTALSLYTSALKRAAENRDPNDPMLRPLAAIVGSALRAGDIVRRMRDIAQTGSVQGTQVELRSLVEETVSLLRADHADVPIRIDVPESTFAEADPISLQQVLFNLLRNACEAIQSQIGGIITVTSVREADELRICVVDNGPGIDEATMETLFEAGGSSKRGGMGVGLSISRTIVEAHGGKIHAENLPDRGARLCVTLRVQS